MATSGDLAKALSELLKEPFSTVDLYGRHLRAAGMLSVKGHGRGAAEMTARDAATWLISLVIDHPRGGDFAAETARVLRLPLFEATIYPEHFLWDLKVKDAKNAGQAIEFLMHDCLHERIRHPMEDLKRDNILSIGIDPGGDSIAPGLHGPHSPEVFSAALLVYRRGPEKPKPNLWRNHILHGRVLLELARVLDLKVPVT
ncbi:hypothetical protein E4K66_30360 [Bradyrhizobium frederickii]|uniref:Uncharacterized protein n=1 Tax=Bradyrhizobium frederickii TaxID=2560054 RepID=A0A4Y9KYG0_9BRAD|nr:hypothetical protein [Bradyrhizobium frederickii]TFV34702.1 hypothetical protein E4K66_30360 [Bradyrhizobium frederickii]